MNAVQIGVDIPVYKLPPGDPDQGPADVDQGPTVNAMIADAINHGRNALKLQEGAATCSNIQVPAGFDLIGLGQWDDLNNQSKGLSPLDWGGGVKLAQPRTGGGIASAIGRNCGNSVAGMLSRVGIHNIAFAARIGVDALKPGRNLPLLDIQHVFRADLDVAFTGVLATHLRLRNVWDTRIQRLRSLLGGYSDHAATASDPLLDRDPTRIERALAASHGHPAILVESPDLAAGCDVTNNLRIHDAHVEGSLCNAVLLLIRGTNAIQVRVAGKFEGIEGQRPLIVADGLYQGDFCVWAHGAASGAPPCDIGGMRAGAPYAGAAPCPGLILLNDCHGMRLHGGVSWVGGGPGRLRAFVRATGCSGLHGALCVRDGLPALLDAMLSTDAACVDCDALRFHVPPSVAAAPGANTRERITL